MEVRIIGVISLQTLVDCSRVTRAVSVDCRDRGEK